MGDGPWPDPQGDRSFPLRARLHIVHDQRRLVVIVDGEARSFATHLDLDLRPCRRTMSTYDSYLEGVSLRSRNHGQSGCEMYWTA